MIPAWKWTQWSVWARRWSGETRDWMAVGAETLNLAWRRGDRGIALRDRTKAADIFFD